MTDLQIISDLLADSAALKSSLVKNQAFLNAVAKTAVAIKKSIAQGGTIFVCGNGGSTCDAMHFVEELVARFKRERPGIRAMHFMDSSILTCWSNDYDYHDAFARQARTFCTEKDLLIGISTSGNSKNILAAIDAANTAGSVTVGFSGKDGGKLNQHASINIVVPSEHTERIQEVHITVIHILCELLERV